MNDGAEPKQPAEYDREAWYAALLEANPWAKGFPFPTASDWRKERGHAVDETFRAARKQACWDRLQAGRAEWNRWAEAMLAAREALETDGHWRIEGRWLVEGDKLVYFLQRASDEALALTLLAQADFANQSFDEGVGFREFHFPGPTDLRGATFLGEANFEGVVFKDGVAFEGAAFSGQAVFGDATFSDQVVFQGATFFMRTDFHGAAFFGEANFQGAAFSESAVFQGATFSGQAVFRGAAFSEQVNFLGVTFLDRADYRGAAFSKLADFHSAVFLEQTNFQRVTFSGSAVFEDARFLKTAEFKHAAFSERANFEQTKFSGWAAFQDVKFTQRPVFRSASFLGRAVFRSVDFSDRAVFHRALFWDHADFQDAVFTETADFESAKFSKTADFLGAAFAERAIFRSAEFSGWADLQGAAFMDRADFQGAAFSNQAVFQGVEFSKQADFTQVMFHGLTSFDQARFEGAASFHASQGKEGSSFSLAEAAFHEVPDFIQADFQTPPRLDSMQVGQKPTEKRGADVAARWRALRGLADAAHDYERERDFFAGEMLSLRWAVDKPFPWFWKRVRREWKVVEGERKQIEVVTRPLGWPGGDRYWFGVLYRTVSNFGRSILRPLMVWLLFIGLFASLYLDRHLDGPWRETRAAQWLATEIALEDTDLACRAGDGHPEWQALQLSFSKAFVVGGLIDANASFRTQACLYGLTKLDGYSRAVPNTPLSVIFLSAIQVLISATLIFLFLMAVRNQFRIR